MSMNAIEQLAAAKTYRTRKTIRKPKAHKSRFGYWLAFTVFSGCLLAALLIYLSNYKAQIDSLKSDTSRVEMLF